MNFRIINFCFIAIFAMVSCFSYSIRRKKLIHLIGVIFFQFTAIKAVELSPAGKLVKRPPLGIGPVIPGGPKKPAVVSEPIREAIPADVTAPVRGVVPVDVAEPASEAVPSVA